MKILKYFENSAMRKPFIEVNIQTLWDKFYDHFKNDKISLELLFIREILNPLILDKEIEFHKTKSPIDSEPRFGFHGRVEKYRITTSFPDSTILVKLYDRKEEIIMMKFQREPGMVYNRRKTFSHVIKVYNSIDIESKLDMLIDTKKYNL